MGLQKSRIWLEIQPEERRRVSRHPGVMEDGSQVAVAGVDPDRMVDFRRTLERQFRSMRGCGDVSVKAAGHLVTKLGAGSES
jgi:hypothetical protein